MIYIALPAVGKATARYGLKLATELDRTPVTVPSP